METITLITGANRGIGFELARLVGGTVLIGSRDSERGEQAARTLTSEGVDAHAVQLDVADADSIEAAAKHVSASYGRLDTLVNNAAISPPSTHAKPSEVPLDAIRETYETNVFGVVAVTNAMLPLLRLSPTPQILNVSSGLGSLGMALDESRPHYAYNLIAYNTSKTALHGVTLAYAKELRDTPIRVNAVTPAFCATGLNDYRGIFPPGHGARLLIRQAARIADEGLTGMFLDDDGSIPW